MLTVEKDVEAHLVERVEKAGGLCLKFPAIYCEGIPDRLVVLPGGKIIFVELKRPKGGRLSEMQKYQIAKLRKRGARVEVLKNKQEIDDFMEEMTQ